MKTSDFRPEHFEKGRNFSKNDFDAYIKASEEYNQAMKKKYFPCWWAGIILGIILSVSKSAFGNILAVFCIFGGMILGSILKSGAAKDVKKAAAKLNITKADVAAARKHVKNGTVAWADKKDSSRESGTKEEKTSLSDCDSYTLDMGLNDLTALFRTYPQLDHAKIQAVGQKIFDSEIPLVSGVGGMHQLYARFKERMPMYSPVLSRIWDGIGDWAD